MHNLGEAIPGKSRTFIPDWMVIKGVALVPVKAPTCSLAKMNSSFFFLFEKRRSNDSEEWSPVYIVEHQQLFRRLSRGHNGLKLRGSFV